MSIENKGPGGVGNAYGRRTSTQPSQINSGKPKDVYTAFYETPNLSRAYPGTPIETWTAGSGNYANTGPAGRTWQTIFATRSPAYAIRVTYRNPQIVPITIDKTAITPSATYVPSGDPTGGTPTNVLFAGGAACVMPAAPSVAEESLTSSDWTFVSPQTWTGVTSGRSLYSLRSYIVNANYSYISSTNLAAYTDNVVGGLVRQTSFSSTAVDNITTPAGYVGTGGNAVAFPVMLEFREVARVVNMLGIGDSTYNCSTVAIGGQYASWLEGCANVLNGYSTGSFFTATNMGWASQSLAAYATRLTSILAMKKYDVVFIQTHSPNSAPTTQAALDADINRVLDMVNKVRAVGSVPVLTLGNPAVIIGAAADVLRQQSNTTFRRYASSFGIAIVDIDAQVSDGATPARLKPDYSSDGTHITTTLGQDLWIRAAANAVLTAS